MVKLFFFNFFKFIAPFSYARLKFNTDSGFLREFARGFH